MAFNLRKEMVIIAIKRRAAVNELFLTITLIKFCLFFSNMNPSNVWINAYVLERFNAYNINKATNYLIFDIIFAQKRNKLYGYTYTSNVLKFHKVIPYVASVIKDLRILFKY